MAPTTTQEPTMTTTRTPIADYRERFQYEEELIVSVARVPDFGGEWAALTVTQVNGRTALEGENLSETARVRVTWVAPGRIKVQQLAWDTDEICATIDFEMVTDAVDTIIASVSASVSTIQQS
jgi:hypothetical protein